MIDELINYGSNPEAPTIFDRMFAETILRMVPQAVEPNHITVFRFATIPVILYLLLSEHYYLGLIAFSVSALSDALDGALARTRNKITDWGRMYDPLADKLLIISVGAVLISKHISLEILLLIIALELVLVLFALGRRRLTGEVITAMLPGKIKMVLQSAAMLLLLLFSITPGDAILASAQFLLHAAIFFALVSLFVYRSI
jgi:cardiolipin synthase (CMP-forming)